MTRRSSVILMAALCLTASGGIRLRATQQAPRPADTAFDVRAFGAKGDGKTIDTAAINRAIDAAAAAGGGTVRFPAGMYPSFSIRLKSHVGLFLDHGATLVAAAPGPEGPGAEVLSRELRIT